jgi:hypothetical protein
MKVEMKGEARKEVEQGHTALIELRIQTFNHGREAYGEILMLT